MRDWSSIDKEFVIKNKELLLIEKKTSFKKADAFNGALIITTQSKSDVNKASNMMESENDSNPNEEDNGVIKRRLIINSTNLIDSHMDCHIQGLWKKSLNEVKQFHLLKEHEMCFESIICDSKIDNIKAFTQNYSFKELGFPEYKGNAECLVFDAEIKESVNEYMYDLYLNNRVNNHSVGMQYVKLFLCIDSEDPEDAQYKESWDKYYPYVANKEVADTKGYFWAVTEAKFIEGSAVVKGSNQATPTMEIESKNNYVGNSLFSSFITDKEDSNTTVVTNNTQTALKTEEIEEKKESLFSHFIK